MSVDSDGLSPNVGLRARILHDTRHQPGVANDVLFQMDDLPWRVIDP